MGFSVINGVNAAIERMSAHEDEDLNKTENKSKTENKNKDEGGGDEDDEDTGEEEVYLDVPPQPVPASDPVPVFGSVRDNINAIESPSPSSSSRKAPTFSKEEEGVEDEVFLDTGKLGGTSERETGAERETTTPPPPSPSLPPSRSPSITEIITERDRDESDTATLAASHGTSTNSLALRRGEEELHSLPPPSLPAALPAALPVSLAQPLEREETVEAVKEEGHNEKQEGLKGTVEKGVKEVEEVEEAEETEEAEEAKEREEGEEGEVLITMMAAAKIRLDSLNTVSKDTVSEDDQACSQTYSGGDNECDDSDESDESGGGVYDAINTGTNNYSHT